MIAWRPTSWKAMFCAEWRAAVAIGHGGEDTLADRRAAHCSTCMPPIEPPITQNSLSMPRWSISSFCARTMSATVMTGKPRPQGSPVRGLMSRGPVVPMQPPSTLAQMTK